ncbi:unnamed protein product [Hyaloperonospora brassicae]|uniref:AMP-binding enzyme C-terminal domain-containing protein n=1 Tax=Hyaloperonospora brassicae TaxID=162125 RepID=A0AAV0TUT7_HYABA|nr:unnamed protein product [Hyaloperonospora brassicae]
MGDWLLAVHAGAGKYGDSATEPAYLSLLRAALESAHDRILADARRPPSAAQIAVHLLRAFEHSSFTNAGRGANLTEHGQVECEASVVCGRTGSVACCGAVRGVREPSALALKLLEQAERAGDRDVKRKFACGRQPPLVLVGEHTRQVARDFGLETATDDAEALKTYHVTPKSRAHWAKWHERFQAATARKAEATTKTRGDNEDVEHLDTVGSVCMDSMGNVAAALSSGGVLYKVPGRLGLAGCPRMGCDAANARGTQTTSRKRKRRERRNVANAFAVACTGRGEQFMQHRVVSGFRRRLSKSANLEKALRKAFVDSKRCGDAREGIEGGVLALVSLPRENDDDTARRVQLGAAFTTPCMGVGYLQCRANAKPEARVQLLRRPEVSARHPPGIAAKKFDADGWFQTGDIVQYSNDYNSFRIRGRASADILKTAGYKVSALDVERVLLTHPQVLECAVFGLPDETWGQLVAAIIRSRVHGKSVGPDALSPPLVEFLKEHLASYRVPRKYLFVDEIPKNAMGKVNKKALSGMYSETA